jgi:hypothetical protein
MYYMWTTLLTIDSICSYICNIDASYALFFRHPPRMTFSELDIELASPESCFQALTKEECFVELKTWRSKSGFDNKSLTIRTAVETLSDPSTMMTGSILQAFSHLSVLNMFTLVHALYLQVYHIQTSGIRLLDTAHPVAVALKQWMNLWSSSSRDAELINVVHKGSQISTAWQTIGFIKHAPEYWLLIHLSLQKGMNATILPSSPVQGAITRREDVDMGEAKSLIAELKSVGVYNSFE